MGHGAMGTGTECLRCYRLSGAWVSGRAEAARSRLDVRLKVRSQGRVEIHNHTLLFHGSEI